MRTLYEKLARVRPETKQYRRALQMLEQGDHDWHMTKGLGTGGGDPVLPRILEAGSIRPGQNNVITRGIPFNNYGRGRPYNGWFQGGAHVIPSAKHEALGAIPLGPFSTSGSDYQYAAGSKGTPITRGDTIIHDGDSARTRLPHQSELKFRPMHQDAYYRAQGTHRGGIREVNNAMTKKPGATLEVPKFPNWSEIAAGAPRKDGERAAPPLSSSSLFPSALLHPKLPATPPAPPPSLHIPPSPQAHVEQFLSNPHAPLPANPSALSNARTSAANAAGRLGSAMRRGGSNVLKALGFR